MRTEHKVKAAGDTRSPSPDRSISQWSISTCREDSYGNQRPSARPGRTSHEAARAGALAEPEEEPPELEGEYSPRKPSKLDSSFDPRNPDEVVLLISNTGILQCSGTKLVTRARRITAQLDAHRQMGAELDWDYDSDTEDDTRIVKSSGDMGGQISKLHYDAAQFILQICKRMGRFSGSPLGLDLQLHRAARSPTPGDGRVRGREVHITSTAYFVLFSYYILNGYSESARIRHFF